MIGYEAVSNNTKGWVIDNWIKDGQLGQSCWRRDPSTPCSNMQLHRSTTEHKHLHLCHIGIANANASVSQYGSLTSCMFSPELRLQLFSSYACPHLSTSSDHLVGSLPATNFE